MNRRPADDIPPPDEPVDIEPEANGHGPRPFIPFDLSELHDRGVPPPRLICNDLLYPHGIHSLASEPDCGKTTIAWWCAAQILRDGGVVAFFDEECGEEMTAEKILGLGITADELKGLRYYPFPARTWSEADIFELHRSVEKEKPVLSVFDSSAAFMGRAGLEENDAGDVTRFYMRVLTPVARTYGSAVLVIDHDAKGPGGENGKPAASISRYSRGSGAKLAAIDVQYKLVAVKPFSRATDGVIKLECTKDRRGWIHPRKYRLTISRMLEVHFLSEQEARVGEADDMAKALTPAEAAVYKALTENAAGWDRINRRMVGLPGGKPLARDTITKACGKLVAAGLAEAVDAGGGRGNEATWIRSHPAEPPLIPLDPPGEADR